MRVNRCGCWITEQAAAERVMLACNVSCLHAHVQQMSLSDQSMFQASGKRTPHLAADPTTFSLFGLINPSPDPHLLYPDDEPDTLMSRKEKEDAARAVSMDHNYHNREPDSKEGQHVSGVIKFDYVQFSLTKMGDYFSSDLITINESSIPMNWWIEIGKETRHHMATMSFWANCKPVDPDAAAGWYCYADLDFRLLPNDRDEECVIIWKHTDLFSKITGAAGFYEFDGWNDIKDPRNGFIKNDTISVEVVVKEMCTLRLKDEMKPVNGICSCDGDRKIMTYDLTDMLRPDSKFKDRKPDVLIEIGNNYLKCHRMLLSRSQYLRSKLSRISSSLPADHIIPLTLSPAFDMDAFLSVMNFFYNDILMLDKYNVGLVFSIATALKIESIRRACLTILSPTTVLHVLSVLSRDSDEEIFDDCEKTFIELSRKAIRSKSFRKLERSLLKRILVINELRCKEIDLFDAVVGWSEAECKRKGLAVNPTNMRTVLGDSLYNIRFGHMSLKEFKSGPKASGLLTKSECIMIKKFIKTKETKPGFLFPTQPRTPAPESAPSVS